MNQNSGDPGVGRRVSWRGAALAGVALAAVVLLVGIAPASRASANGPYIPTSSSGINIGTSDQYYGYGGYGLGYGLGYGGYGGYGLGYGGYGGYGLGYGGYGGYGLGYGLGYGGYGGYGLGYGGYGGYGLGYGGYGSGVVNAYVTTPPPPRTYNLGGQYCAAQGGGQVWVPTGAPTPANVTCGTQSTSTTSH